MSCRKRPGRNQEGSSGHVIHGQAALVSFLESTDEILGDWCLSGACWNTRK